MSCLRSTAEFFNSSTQATDKLLELQSNGNIQQYTDYGRAVKMIQDVVTRWWSTWRAAKRGRWLKTAIMTLKVQQVINCPTPTDKQWTILHQIEITLHSMAQWQRMLEGDKYPTGSMVPLAVYRIRRAYMIVINSKSTLHPVKMLTALLLKDFNERYMPADDEGAVQYTSTAEQGFRNRYTNIHPFLFLAAIMDPRMKDMLHGEVEGKEYIMIETEYEQLKKDVVTIMVAEAKKMKEKEEPGEEKKKDAIEVDGGRWTAVNLQQGAQKNMLISCLVGWTG